MLLYYCCPRYTNKFRAEQYDIQPPLERQRYGVSMLFETFTLNETTTNTVEAPTFFAYPPLPWIGARFKFEVRDQDGTKALTKTIDNKSFQRGTVFIGDQSAKNYTI